MRKSTYYTCGRNCVKLQVTHHLIVQVLTTSYCLKRTNKWNAAPFKQVRPTRVDLKSSQLYRCEIVKRGQGEGEIWILLHCNMLRERRSAYVRISNGIRIDLQNMMRIPKLVVYKLNTVKVFPSLRESVD
uniref:Uncharacterized protein n=1 Tax=Glossina austeni TaxID=7395 RepID=A0A1A9V0L1_GLOAU